MLVPVLCPISYSAPANASGKAGKDGSMLGLLSLIWDTQVQFQTPGNGLTHLAATVIWGMD